jgi:hypothetical protein
MSKKLRPQPEATLLWIVEKNFTTEELDDEFGIIPGEMAEVEAGLEAEMAVVEMFEAERRVVRDMREGRFVDGVWWDALSRRDWDGAVELVGGWTRRLDMLTKKAAVMDARCIKIVRRVWHGVL